MKLLLWVALTAYSFNCSADVCSPPADPQLNGFGNFATSVKKICNQLDVQFDPKLIQQWKASDSLPCPGPFQATFQKDGKTLTFLAVEHLKAPIDLNHPELLFIKKKIQKNHPDKILAETGHPYAGGDTSIPKEEITNITQSCLKAGQFTCPESAYTIFVGDQLGIKSFGGDPSPTEIYSSLVKKFSIDDLYAFSSTRALWTLRVTGVPKTDWPKAVMAEVRKEISERNGPWSYTDYLSWLKTHLGKDTTPENFSLGWLEPRSDADANSLQKIAAAMDEVREPLLLRETQNLVNQGDRTMVIYGSGHFVKQRPALEKALGAPQIECLSRDE